MQTTQYHDIYIFGASYHTTSHCVDQWEFYKAQVSNEQPGDQNMGLSLVGIRLYQLPI